MSMRIWKTGERCIIATPDGRKVPGSIVLASTNGLSLAVSFEAILAGYVGMMPLLWNEARGTFENFHGVPVVLEEGGP